MNIWVVRQTCLYDNESYVTSHLTEKGALITAINTVRRIPIPITSINMQMEHRDGMPMNTSMKRWSTAIHM